VVAIDRVSRAQVASDLAARTIAFASCALFSWVWLSVWLSIILGIAGSRSIDASPAAILAGAALTATVVLAIGLFLMQMLFGIARDVAARAILLVRAYWRRAIRAVLITAGTIVGAFGLVGAIAGVIYGTGFAIGSSFDLILATAEQIEALPLDYTVGSAIALARAFAQIYVATAVFAVLLAIPYVGWRWLRRNGRV